MKIKLTFISQLIFTLLLIFAVERRAVAQDDEFAPLNLSQIKTALLKKKATIGERNAVLIKGINERKITFLATPENEKKLTSWGANRNLIEAVRKNAQSVSMLQPNAKTFKNALGIELVLIPKGEFLMGLAENDFGDYSERPQHKVKIDSDFFIGKYEVTQGQWKSVFGKNPSAFANCGDDCPIDSVSWDTVQKFIAKLNEKNDGYVYRLPTEAEWEYAARAGTKTPYYWGSDEESKAWQFLAHQDNQSPVEVGSYLPNAFGLFDMTGNIWEYCDDVWRYDFKKSTDSGLSNKEGDAGRRTMRGGGFSQFTTDLRLSRRGLVDAKEPHYSQGFRLAATVKK